MNTVTIRLFGPTDELPIELLLLADPSEASLQTYLSQSNVLLATDDAEILGVVVIMVLSGEQAEIKNIAVHPNRQGQGLGRQLLQAAIIYARQQHYKTLLIGTGNSSIGQLALYQKMGFSMTDLWLDYFTRHYPEPIYEHGILCRHMIRLEYALGQ